MYWTYCVRSSYVAVLRSNSYIYIQGTWTPTIHDTYLSYPITCHERHSKRNLKINAVNTLSSTRRRFSTESRNP